MLCVAVDSSVVARHHTSRGGASFRPTARTLVFLVLECRCNFSKKKKNVLVVTVVSIRR